MSSCSAPAPPGSAAALAVRPVRSVLIVTKDVLDAGSTAWAQGGLAGVLDPTDSFEDHVRDTLAAGAGLCDEAVVRELVAEAPTAIRYLMRLGAAFDPAADGRGSGADPGGRPQPQPHRPLRRRPQRRRGAAHARRVGDGRRRRGARAGVRPRPRASATAPNGSPQAAGVTIALLDPHGAVESVGASPARAVVLATGGYGQVFASTSNPPAVTGDGVAMALRAGLDGPRRRVRAVPPDGDVARPGRHRAAGAGQRGRARRGRDPLRRRRRRVMAGVHPQEDLAPRDVVAAAISRRMAEAPGGVDDHVFLDATHLGERFYERFPSITAACREIGIDPARDRIPVAPAAHYACGGVPARLDGTTALPGLFAVGEVACTGRPRRQPAGVEQPHRERRRRHPARARPGVGAARARRRSARSATESARRRSTPRIGREVRRRCPATSACSATPTRSPPPPTCWTRSPARPTPPERPTRAAWEATNLLTVAAAVVAGGCSTDGEPGLPPPDRLPRARDEWLRHLDVRSTATAVECGRPDAVFTFHPLADRHPRPAARRRARPRRRRRRSCAWRSPRT